MVSQNGSAERFRTSGGTAGSREFNFRNDDLGHNS